MNEPTSLKVADERLQLVSFTVGGEEFGVDIRHVQEINRTLEITQIPETAEHIVGIVNLRGRVIPIIDLRVLFGMAQKDRDKHSRIVVMELDGKAAGFMVDGVREVLRIPRDVTEEPPAVVGSSCGEYITAIGKLDDRLLILLDVEKILGHKTVSETA